MGPRFQLQHDFTDSDRVPDGKICLNDTGELAITKIAVEPVSFV